MISIIEAVAQAENESRSDNIKWGIKRHAAQGTSKLYNRKCYGYINDAEGKLVIDKKEAKNVHMIFNLYLQGKSVLGIVKELERLGIGKIARMEVDMKQEDLAKAVGVTRQTISLIESGEYNPTLNLCIAICKELSKTLNDLFWEESKA